MYPNAYLDYLVYFHGNRDYFECHEVLEEHWKQDQRGERDNRWVALIQLAVGLYHQRRGNVVGAKRMLSNVLTFIHSEELNWHSLGLEVTNLEQLVRNRIEQVEQNRPYQPLNLPITDPMLLLLCQLQSQSLGLTWKNSDTASHFIIHKHRLRDRSEVINERLYQKTVRLSNSY